MKKKSIRLLTTTALFAALTCICTMIIKIPIFFIYRWDLTEGISTLETV